jgi:hypothetical protein
MILGLDISTSCTGYAILSASGQPVEIGHVSLDKLEGTWSKADAVREWAQIILSRWQIEHIFIEQSLSAFRPGFSSAATLGTLTRFNGIVSYIVRQAFSIDPEFIGATAARTKCGIKIKKGKGVPKGKEQVFQFVTANMLFREWPRGRTGKVKDHCYDEVDGFVIAEAGRRIVNSRKSVD